MRCIYFGPMAHSPLTILNDVPRLKDATLLLALTGWMDGGDVSTGTVKRLMEGRDAAHVARIEAPGFYIDNFPGSMEVTALFRPHVRYEGGLVEEFEMAQNDFYADPASNTAFFIGREPNLNWPGFADCLYDVVGRLGVKRIIFMGSFGGAVPHTREPRLYGSVSERRLLPLLKQHGLRPTEYEGPASFATYLLTRSPGHKVEMLSIAAEIPGYLQGENPLSIAAVTRRLSAMLNLPVDVSALRAASTQWELDVTEAVEKDEKLTETVRELEEQYDNDLISASAHE
jgi:proteasome assembly chaperone (PAC2) family protein